MASRMMWTLSASSASRCESLVGRPPWMGRRSAPCAVSTVGGIAFMASILWSWSGLRRIGVGCDVSLAGVQPALLFRPLFPPPSSGALGFAGRDRAGAGGAADRQEAAIMQPVAGNAVVADECDHPFARPVEQRVHLDEPVARIDRGVGHAGPLHRLVGAQAGDPRRSTRKGASERFDLADRAAGVPGVD